MAGIPFKTTGILFSHNQRTALLLSANGRPQTLRLGFVLIGSEATVLPETLLDDWGHEIGGLDLYLWISENAAHFPRAEIFGLDLYGVPRQCFVRELELSAGFTCFAYENASTAALTDWAKISEILVPQGAAGQQRLTEAPAEIPFPLRRAAVAWWTVDGAAAERAEYDFYRMAREDELGDSV